jgi:hypothetical protein
MEIIPLSVVPLIEVITTKASTTTTKKLPSATPLIALEKSVKLEKSMEEMTLQGTKINRLNKEMDESPGAQVFLPDKLQH